MQSGGDRVGDGEELLFANGTTNTIQVNPSDLACQSSMVLVSDRRLTPKEKGYQFGNRR